MSEALIFRHLREDVPNAKQIEFLTAKEQNICYGGARGGGKSWVCRRKAVMLCMRYAQLHVLLLRRTMPELRTNHILPLRQELEGYADWSEQERTFRFPNGSRLELGYCDNDSDVLHYQGQQTDAIFWEEATLFNPDWIELINASVRTVRPNWRVRFYYSCNPGGAAHGYIKRLFIDRVYKAGEDPSEYRMIRAYAEDNHVLMSADPGYIDRLKRLPPAKMRAMLYGDWNVYEGQVFESFTDDISHYGDRINTHVIQPFAPPDWWQVYRSFDFGYAKPFSVGWWTVDSDGRYYRILELYGCIPNEPNTGVRWSPDKIFEEIARTEREHPWLRGKEIIGVADPSIWDSSRGVSIEEESNRHGVYWSPGDNKRIPGWMQVQQRLQFDANGIPMMYFFSNCKDTIRTLPLLQYSKIHPEDVDTSMEDHIADEIRYFCMMHPIESVYTAPTKPKVYDPLSTDDTPIGRYNFYKI